MSDDYNGWVGFGDRDSAYLTWNMNLWIDNEESSYKSKMRFLRRQMQYFLDNETPEEDMDLDENEVKLFCLNLFPKGTPDFELAKEIKKVCWEEIAENWKTEMIEDHKSSGG